MVVSSACCGVLRHSRSADPSRPVVPRKVLQPRRSRRRCLLLPKSREKSQVYQARLESVTSHVQQDVCINAAASEVRRSRRTVLRDYGPEEAASSRRRAVGTTGPPRTTGRPWSLTGAITFLLLWSNPGRCSSSSESEDISGSGTTTFQDLLMV